MEEKPAAGVRYSKMNVGRHLINFGINPAAFAYAMTTLGAGMINNIFSFYYVKLFINKYKVSEGAFQQSQVRYLQVHVAVVCMYVCKGELSICKKKTYKCFLLYFAAQKIILL